MPRHADADSANLFGRTDRFDPFARRIRATGRKTEHDETERRKRETRQRRRRLASIQAPTPYSRAGSAEVGMREQMKSGQGERRRTCLDDRIQLRGIESNLMKTSGGRLDPTFSKETLTDHPSQRNACKCETSGINDGPSTDVFEKGTINDTLT